MRCLLLFALPSSLSLCLYPFALFSLLLLLATACSHKPDSRPAVCDWIKEWVFENENKCSWDLGICIIRIKNRTSAAPCRLLVSRSSSSRMHLLPTAPEPSFSRSGFSSGGSGRPYSCQHYNRLAVCIWIEEQVG